MAETDAACAATKPEQAQAHLLNAKEMESALEQRVAELRKRREALLRDATATGGHIAEAEFWLDAIRNSKPAPGTVIAKAGQDSEAHQ